MPLKFTSKVAEKLNKKLATMRTEKTKKFSYYLEKQRPAIILGNQKTGSTAIAALLAEATGESVTLDIQRAIQDVGWQLCVKYGISDFKEVAYRYKEDFSREIIKEPNLTFFYEEMVSLFPNAKFVFIQRNPLQNIRSILNRLKVPGSLQEIKYDDWPELRKTPVWRLALDSTWLGRPRGSYIEGMAHRWDVAARTYLDNKDAFISIRYEDFKQNKKAEIENLARHLGLTVRKDISGSVDVQHQPKGDSDVSAIDFFGEGNIDVIRNICGDSASKLGYEL